MLPDAYEIPLALAGQLFIMPKPRGGDWLADEMHGLRNMGVDVLVSLLEGSEVVELGLEDEAALFEACGGQFVQYPIRDRTVPSNTDFSLLVESLANDVERGKGVAVHCRAGIGRSGLVVSCVLIKLGVPSDDAIDKLSAARRLKIPDTREQEEWIHAFSRSTRIAP